VNLLLFNKPFNVLCQFTDTAGRQTLAHYIQRPGFYAAGRLDQDSEGLLLLTNCGQLQQRITDPRFKLIKKYCVQVEGTIDHGAIASLAQGVKLKDGKTRAAQARQITQPAWLWPRNPPIRERRSIATSWLELSITEGKSRQVRRMTAAVGFPTLRLIRTAIGPWRLDSFAPPLAPGESRSAQIEKSGLYQR